MAIEDKGDCCLLECNDMNIPVGIIIGEPDEDNDKWVLTADNYTPRKSRIGPDAYEVEADSREDLVQLVQAYVVPLYEAALSQLKAGKDLYYWNQIETEGE
jgi:hypothetical protein